MNIGICSSNESIFTINKIFDIIFIKKRGAYFLKNSKNYKLESATKGDIELLISYKLASILDYAKDLPKEEIEKITNYVKTTIPKQINDYNIIIINNKKVGCLLLEKYEDGILLNEIYLDKNYRRKGIGTNILDNILYNNSKVYLWVYKENFIALNLYKKLGFKIKETTETRYFMKYER